MLADALALWARLAGAQIRSQMQYRTSFAIQSAVMFGVMVSDLAPVWILSRFFGSLDGWSFAELALLYGMVETSWSSVETVLRGFENFSVYLIQGDLDRILLRPRSVILQVATRDFDARKLSLGQRMRCELSAALLHSPRLLFLDEPTIGLDVLAKEAIREFLATENSERGTTILLTTHDLSDIERLCPRMILIDRGRVVYDGAVDAIRREFGSERRLVVDFEAAAPNALPDGVEVEERGPARMVLRFRRDRIGAAALIGWLGENASIADLSLEEPPIERIVAELYRRGRP